MFKRCRREVRVLAGTGVVLMLLLKQAAAADLGAPVYRNDLADPDGLLSPRAFVWTGLYAGVQAGYEKALSILYPVLAGATSVGPIGQVENGFVFSFRQLVIDHEIASFVKRLLRGIEVTEDTLALDTIEEVGPGGDFISLPHTVEHFRQELWISDVGEFAGYEAGVVETHRGAEEKALEKARTILATHDPHPLSKEQEAEIDRIVASALRR